MDEPDEVYEEIITHSNALTFKVTPNKIAIWRAVMKCRYHENNNQDHYSTTWKDRERFRGQDGRFEIVEVEREGSNITGLHDSLLTVSDLTSRKETFTIHIFYGNQKNPEWRTVEIQGSYRTQWKEDEFRFLKQIVNAIYNEGPGDIWQAAQAETPLMPPPPEAAAGAQQNQNPPPPQPEVPGEAPPPPAEEAVVDDMANLNINNGADQAGDIPGNA